MSAGSDVEFATILRDIATELVALRREVERDRKTGGNATITANVSAGGVGVWIATTSCILCLAGCIVIGYQVSRMQTEILALESADREKSAYLAAIYAQAPQLKAGIKIQNERVPNHP